MKYNKGFTLVELIVILDVMALLLTTIFSMLISGFESFNFGSTKANVQSDIRLVEEVFNKNLRNAENIKINNSGKLENNSNTSEIILEKGKDGQYYLKNNDRKITEAIFTDIVVKVDNIEINENKTNSILELKLKFEDNEPYQIKILLNNFDFDNEGWQESLINHKLEYQTGGN